MDRHLWLRAAGATATRSLRVYLRYPFNAVMQFFNLLVWLPPLYFLGRAFMVNDRLPGLAAYTGTDNYTAFLVIGWIAAAFVYAAYWGVGFSLYNEMTGGTLEAVWLSPAPRWTVLIGRSVHMLLITAVQASVVLAAAWLLGVRFTPDALRAVWLLLPGLVALCGLGLAVAALVLVAKNPSNLIDNELDLAGLDYGLLGRWVEQGQRRAGDEFELGWWDNEYPESLHEEIAAMFDAMNRAPRGDLELEDQHWTADELREFERSDRATGNDRWTLYARQRETGRIAGWTEVTWHPNRPHILGQRGTGVFPEFQGRGLGKWLKAAMLERVLRERPQVRYVRSENAFQNAPMLAINNALGFRPHFSRYTWQVETDRVVAYLVDRGIHVGS